VKFTHAVLFALALVCGVAIGYMFNPAVEETAPTKSVRTESAVRDAGDAASLQALRARIAELEAKLAKRGEESGERSEEKVAENADRGERRDRRGPFGGMSPKEWREKMKKENPEQYAQMTNGIARWRAERMSRAQKKVDFLSSIDVSKMSPAARRTHTELQGLIAKREEMEQKMHEMEDSDEGLTHDERREMWQEMHQTDQQIRELNSRERENLIVEAAKNLGFQGQEASDVAETFQEIIENTEGGFNTTGRPGRGRNGNGGNAGPGGMPPPPPPGN